MHGYIQNLRRVIGNMKIIVPGVRGLIFRKDGALLLEKQKHFGSWSLPHGCVDVGQSAYDALVSEVLEETGLSVLRAEPFGLYTDPKYSITYPNGDEVQTFTVAFLVTEWTGQLRPGGEEVEQLGFFDLNALPGPLYPIHVETIEDYRRHEGKFILR